MIIIPFQEGFPSHWNAVANSKVGFTACRRSIFALLPGNLGWRMTAEARKMEDRRAGPESTMRLGCWILLASDLHFAHPRPLPSRERVSGWRWFCLCVIYLCIFLEEVKCIFLESGDVMQLTVAVGWLGADGSFFWDNIIHFGLTLEFLFPEGIRFKIWMKHFYENKTTI